MKFGIAYTDKNNNDFQGLPWIEGFFEKYSDAKIFIKESGDKMYNISIFYVKDIIDEQITWEYVNNHKVMDDDAIELCGGLEACETVEGSNFMYGDED